MKVTGPTAGAQAETTKTSYNMANNSMERNNQLGIICGPVSDKRRQAKPQTSVAEMDLCTRSSNFTFTNGNPNPRVSGELTLRALDSRIETSDSGIRDTLYPR